MEILQSLSWFCMLNQLHNFSDFKMNYTLHYPQNKWHNFILMCQINVLLLIKTVEITIQNSPLSFLHVLFLHTLKRELGLEYGLPKPTSSIQLYLESLWPSEHTSLLGVRNTQEIGNDLGHSVYQSKACSGLQWLNGLYRTCRGTCVCDCAGCTLFPTYFDGSSVFS